MNTEEENTRSKKENEEIKKSKIEILKLSSKNAGYTGDICDICGNFTMVRNGTCLLCLTCGSTTGCS
jgi:ribonucleoside-diphosphate reductase alpha chain